MSQRYAFTTVDRVLAKHHRELRGLEIHEADALEWVGDALGFMQMPNVSEEAVAFFEVVNHHADLPGNLHFITQVAKHNDIAESITPQSVVYNGATEATSDGSVAEVAQLQITASVTTAGSVIVTLNGIGKTIAVSLNDTPVMVADKIRTTLFDGWNTGGTVGTDVVTFTATSTGVRTDATYSHNGTGATGTMTTTTQGVNPTTDSQTGVCLDENGNLIEGTQYAYYRPYFDLQYEYLDWAYSGVRQQAFTPVKLADHTFFNSLVCREEDPRIAQIYNTCNDEYTVVGNVNRKLRFSFKEGYVAVSFTRQAIDKETGYPLIPDNQDCLEAINYFLTWKFMQRSFYLGREGSTSKVDYAEKRWLKYKKQFTNHAFGPFGVDDFEDIKNQSNYMLPRQRLYDNYFGNLSHKENRAFANPQSNQRRQ